jgi:hypothetical protein
MLQLYKELKMTYEEKMIRCIASKLIQRKHLALKHCFPTVTQLSILVNRVLEDLIEEYRQLKLIRIHTKDGFITPIIKKSVDKLVL